MGIMLSGHFFPLLLDAVPVGSKRRAYERWAVELSDGSSIRVRPPNLALLSRDDCPPSLQCGTLGSRSGRGSRRRGAGRAEFAGRRTENVHVSGAFLSDSGRTESAALGMCEFALFCAATQKTKGAVKATTP